MKKGFSTISILELDVLEACHLEPEQLVSPSGRGPERLAIVSDRSDMLFLVLKARHSKDTRKEKRVRRHFIDSVSFCICDINKSAMYE
jgi:hypothetical protein